MRVLIVDGNPAIQEILSDMLTMSNQKTEAAGTTDDAAALLGAFDPEVVFMDAVIAGESAAKLLGIVEKVMTHRRPKIYVLTKNDETVPENVKIDGKIHKPFKSSDILKIIEDLEAEGGKEKRSLFKQLKSRMEAARASKEDTGEMNVKFGRSYLFIEDEPNELRKACRSFADKENDVLFITSGNVKAVKETLRNDKMKVLAVSEKEGANYINGSKIGSVTNLMTSFAGSAKRPVIAIDDLLSLIQLNDLNSILTMIHQTVNSGSGRTMTLLASLRPDNLTERDKGLLLHDLQEYDMKGSQ